MLLSSYHERPVALDVLHINSSHVETVVLLQKTEMRF